jgi:hypothetical protein
MFQEHDDCYEDVSIKCYFISDVFEEIMNNVYAHLKISMALSSLLIWTLRKRYKRRLYDERRCCWHESDREIWPSFPETWRKDYSTFCMCIFTNIIFLNNLNNPCLFKLLIQLPGIICLVLYSILIFQKMEDLKQKLETNGNHLRRSMRRKKKPVSLDDEFDIDLHDKPSIPLGKH